MEQRIVLKVVELRAACFRDVRPEHRISMLDNFTFNLMNVVKSVLHGCDTQSSVHC